MSWSGFLSIFILLKKEIRRVGCSFEWLAISSIYITAKFFRSVLIKYARQYHTRIMFYKHRTKRKFPPKYIRINSKQMNRCSSNLELIGPMVGCLMVCEELGHTCVQ